MSTVVQFADLRAEVVEALRLIGRSAGQTVIRVGTDACEVEWSPDAYHHPAHLLPLVLLTAAVDEGAARARWAGVSFAQAVDCACRLDIREKDVLMALAGEGLPVGFAAEVASGVFEVPTAPWRRADFARELAGWVERFGLAGTVLDVEWDRLRSGASDAHYGVRPVADMAEMPVLLKPLPPVQSLAALAILALYNGDAAREGFKGKRKAGLNPPAVESFAALRRLGGAEAHAHLLRLIASYRGW